MTRIDFYILSNQGGSDALTAAARLCDKAVTAGHRLYVSAAEPTVLDSLDDLLWTQRQGSFLAHERYRGQPPVAPLPQLLLGDSEPPAGWNDLLLSLHREVPPFFSRFDRVLEIVPGDAESRRQCRERYKFYRDRGYALKSFEQSAEGGWSAKS